MDVIKHINFIDTVLKPMIVRDLERLHEKVNLEFYQQEFGSAWEHATINNIPVTVKVCPALPDGNVADHTCIEILTGPYTGIRHTLKPVTKEALSKVADDILKVERWGDPRYPPKPVEEEPIHTVEYF